MTNSTHGAFKHLLKQSAAGAVIGGLAIAGASSAHAQDTAEDSADENIIIVTAQKREQDILTVPVAVSAYNDEIIENTGVADFSDIVRVAPSLNINGAANNNESTISLRGIGTFSFSTSAEPSVSVVVDGVAVVQQGQAFANLTDVARIEVLRGPQGTLFGKNASAGVVNIVTKDPSDVFTGSVEGILTDDEEARVNATISGPLGDSLGFRINGYYVNRDGYVNNLVNNDELNGDEGFGIRGKLRWESGPLTISLIGDYSERDVLGNGATLLRFDPGAALFGFIPVDLTGITPGLGNNNLRFDTNPVADNKTFSASGTIEYDFGNHVLTSISSYTNWKYQFNQDVDGTATPFSAQGGPYDSKQFTQELRLTSASDGPLEYMVGLYFADADTDRSFMRTGPAFLQQNWDSTASTKSYAVFAHGTYEFSDQTSLTLGGRLNHEKIGVFFNDNRNALPAITGNESDTAFTGKISLQHFVADDVMLFASFATGYKGQAYDIASGFGQVRVDNPVGAETSMSYEIGAKGRLFDNLLSFAVTGFWTDYDDFQAQSARLLPTGLELLLNNVGKARTKGVEFEATLNPAEGLSLFTQAAYIDAEVRSFASANCYRGQPVVAVATGPRQCAFNATLNRNVQELAGGSLANSPKFKFTVGGSFETPVGSSPFSAFLNANYSWQDDTNFDLFGNPLTVQPSYGIANISLGLKESENENWKVTFFVNNLFDKNYSAGIGDVTNFFGGNVVLNQQLARNFSRYAGMKVKFGF